MNRGTEAAASVIVIITSFLFHSQEVIQYLELKYNKLSCNDFP